MREYRTLRDFQMEQLADWEAAIDYLDVTLEEYQDDEDTSFFLREIRTVVEAQGGISEIAKQAGLEARCLSEMLTSTAAPRLDMFSSILTALGCRLSIQPLKPIEPNAELTAAETSIVASEISTSSSGVSVEKR